LTQEEKLRVMNDTPLSEFLPIAILFTVLILFLLYAYDFFKRRDRRQAESYVGDMRRFNKATDQKDIKSMLYYGDKIIWNVHLEQSDKKIIYQAVEPLVEKYPELDQLWKDVHYKTHGYEPLNIDPDDDPWIVKGSFNASSEDIIDC